MDEIATLSLPDSSNTEPPRLGAHVLPGGKGAVFTTWAPSAQEVLLRWDYVQDFDGRWHHEKEARLNRTDDGLWTGEVPDIAHGDRYLFYVVGPEGGGEGLRRDPCARELTREPSWPDCHCVVRDPSRFTWHDQEFEPPAFHDLVIYQLHIGTWYIPEGHANGTFLDVASRIPYLNALGINAIQPLPVVEFPGLHSLGYNGVDYFSPETDYGVPSDSDQLDEYLDVVNGLLQDVDPRLEPYTRADIDGTANQLRIMVDLCHLHGIAVVLDVVYNHAGGPFSEQGMYFFDEQPTDDQNNSLYFTDRGWAGGLVFAYWKDEVRQFLIDNAKFFLEEYHTDGFRYDEVSVILNEGGDHGYLFCQQITDTCRFVKPQAIHIAEHWPVDSTIVRPTEHGGAGFDATHNDGLRGALRDAISQASTGAGATVDMGRIAHALTVPQLDDIWRVVQCTEDQDVVYRDREWRTARLADGNDSRSWFARSRARFALGIALTAPGIPHLFMGQEFLEDKQWHDEPGSEHQIWWEGLEENQAMSDFLRFTQDLIALRHALPGLRGFGVNNYHHHDHNRVLAFHRWVPYLGDDAVVVASLSDTTLHGYRIGFPGDGQWREVFNSDVYDHWPNPEVSGNGGEIHATRTPMHGLPASAAITLPANGVLVFAR